MARLAGILLFDLRTFRAAPLPRGTAMLVVGNHQSYMDPPLFKVACHGLDLDYVAREGLFRVPWLGALIRSLNATPIRENGGDVAAMRVILKKLGEGRSIVIFPEGARTNDGAMSPFKRGVAILLRRVPCHVTPVAIEGAFDAWPRHKRLPHFRRRVMVMVGKPIPPDELMSKGEEAALRRLEDEIDAMRLVLRARLRRSSSGLYPPSGAGDRSIQEARASEKSL